MERGAFVYILTNKIHTVLYTGVTKNLKRRVLEHRTAQNPKAFTARYNCFKLVYFEFYPRVEEAIHREKQLKKYHRAWKEELIGEENPEWEDLFDGLGE
jgi:putative endonuclease